MKYHFYSDAGHGWLRVPIVKLEKLGIAEKISEYSYMRYDVAYLEEDADLTVFCEAMVQKIPSWKLNDNIKEHMSNISAVRKYEHYNYEKFSMLKKLISRFDNDEIYRKQVWSVVVDESKGNPGDTVLWDNLKWVDISSNGKNWIIHLLPNLEKKIEEFETNKQMLLDMGNNPEKTTLNKITPIVVEN